MGRHKECFTDEDLVARTKRYNDVKQAKKLAGLKREDVKNPCKKTRINEKDGFIIVVETLNRLKMDPIDICFTVNYKYCIGVNWEKIKRGILDTINEWLDDQEIFERKNKIFIFNHPEDSKYAGKCRSFDFQIYLKRIVPSSTLVWSNVYPEVLPLVYKLKTHIINTSPEEGIEIVRRLPPFDKKAYQQRKLLSEIDNA